MTINTVHSMNIAGIVIDGVPVVGMWEGDDAATIETSEDEGAHLIGADGSSVWSQFADRSGIITIKVQPGSPTNAQLTARKQRQDSGVPVSFPVSYFNLGGGEAGVASDCYIMKSKTVSLGKNATVREWKISAANLREG